MRRTMLAVIAAGLLAAGCVLLAAGKARAASYDEATHTITLDAEDVATCAEEKGCTLITTRAAAQAEQAIAVMQQAAAVIEDLSKKLAAANVRLSSCAPDFRPTGVP